MRKFNVSILAVIAAMALPLAAHAGTSVQMSNLTAQAAVAKDPGAAPEAFTTKQHPIAHMTNAQDFFLVNPGGDSTGGGNT